VNAEKCLAERAVAIIHRPDVNVELLEQVPVKKVAIS
jgi:hypothetical protein